MPDKDILKLEENSEVEATLVAEYIGDQAFIAVVQSLRSTTIVLNHYQMRCLRDWLNKQLGNNSRQRLLEELKKMTGGELEHQAADELLVDYINDPEITAAYESLEKWYA